MGYFTDQQAQRGAAAQKAPHRTDPLVELGLLALIAVALFEVAVHLNFFERWVTWLHGRDWVRFDELAVVLFLESIGLSVYRWRSFRHTRAEAHRLVDAARGLAATTEQYRSLFSLNPRAAFYLDREGRLHDVNDAGVDLAGRSAEELRRMPFTSLLELDDMDRGREAFLEILDGRPQELEVGVVHHDGRHLDLAITGIPVVARNQVVGAFILARDVTRDNRIRRGIDDALGRAERATEATTQFLTTTSEELETSLAVVLHATGLLLDTPLDQPQARLVHTVQQQSHELRRLVKEMDSFSRLEPSPTRVETIPFRLHEAVDPAVAAASAAAERKGLAFTVQLDRGVPQRLIGDAERLGQVLGQLLQNAVRFTEAGRVRLAISRGTDPDHLHFAVEDSGVGIHPQRQMALFEALAQDDGAMTPRHEGASLGLSTCQELVVLMGGAIHVHSVPGRGSTFSFRLPLREA